MWVPRGTAAKRGGWPTPRPRPSFLEPVLAPPPKPAASKYGLLVACATAVCTGMALTGLTLSAGPLYAAFGGLGKERMAAVDRDQPSVQTGDAAGQTSQRPVRVAQAQATSFSVDNVSGPPSKALPLTISLPNDDFGDYALLMFRGLPEGFELSSGIHLKESWAVSLRDVPGLTLTAPTGYQGAFLLEVLLVRERNATPESQVIAIDIRPGGSTAKTDSQPGSQQILTAATPNLPDETQLSQPPASKALIAADVEEAMLKRAQELLDNHDVAAARLLFQHLADQGSARGAFFMGQTYDPAFFNSLVAKGLKPEPDKAREWYQRAADLGEPEALKRITALDATQ